MNTEARKRIIAARTAMVLDQPFFGTLALRLRLEEDPTCPTAWVDGVTMGYNPDFVMGLRQAGLIALVAHGVMHCAAGHPWRRDNREPRRWNEACDRVINPILREAKFTLPEGALYELDRSHAGRSSEWVYDRIPAPAPQAGGSSAGQVGGKGEGQGQPQPDPLGEVRDAPPGSEAEALGAGEADWKQAVQQAAAAAKMRGDLPASLDRLARQAAAPRVDWRSVLRRFAQDTARADYSWTRPNTRYLARGLYLPALRSGEVGPIVVAVDTSGSVDQVLLGQFEAEIRAMADEVQPREVSVMYCDARVHRVDTFALGEVITLRPVGGGGTDFRPVFQELEKLDEVPACVVYLTDLEGTFPRQDPGVPTLWVTPSPHRTAPFGETVRVA